MSSAVGKETHWVCCYLVLAILYALALAVRSLHPLPTGNQ